LDSICYPFLFGVAGEQPNVHTFAK
jgi:hypothetical protein